MVTGTGVGMVPSDLMSNFDLCFYHRAGKVVLKALRGVLFVEV